MKFFSSVLVRALIVLLLGIFLTVYPDQTSSLLVQIVGMSFMIPSLLAILVFLFSRKDPKAQDNAMRPVLPLLHTGSFLFGLVLFIWPELFITVTMYVLGILIILFAANQIINLLSLRSIIRVGPGYYILPVLMMTAGILMLIHPLESAGSPFFFLGICCIVCGVTDLINLVCFRRSKCRPTGQPVPTEEKPKEKEPELIE